MDLGLTVVEDGITPDLRRRAAALANKRPALLAMGQAVVSLAKRAFGDPSLRPTPWPPRKKAVATGTRDTRGRFQGGGHAILRKSGDLWKSIHVGAVGNDSVEVGSPKVYAAVHQFGSKKKTGRGSGIPPRPYFPIDGKPDSARFTPRAEQAVENALRRMIDPTLSA